jgi:hypothetical protein
MERQQMIRAEQLVMVRNQNPPSSAGRWAIPEDKPAQQVL